MTKQYDLPDPTKCPHGNIPGSCFYCGDLDADRTETDAERAPADVGGPQIPELVEAKTESVVITVGTATEKSDGKGAHNQDTVLTDERSRLYGVLDGMGGHNAGEVASDKAAQFIVEEMVRMPKGIRHDGAQVADYLRSAIVQANGKLLTMAETDPKLEGMGTTASLIHLVEQPDGGMPREAVIANVGDSRVYRLRGGVLERLTKDQSLIQTHIDRGDLPSDADQVGDPEADAQMTDEQRRTISETRNIISSAVGVHGMAVDVQRVPLEDGDLLFATSDGVHDNLTDREIVAIAQQFTDDPAQLGQELVRASRERSRNKGHVRHKDDDISAIAVRVQGSAPARTREPRAPEAMAVPVEILQEWRGAPTEQLEKTAMTYRDTIDLYEQGMTVLDWVVSRAHGMRTAYEQARTDAERSEILQRDRGYKEAALKEIDAVLATRASGAFADDYGERLPHEVAEQWLVKYEERLRALDHAYRAPEQLLGSMTRFRWETGTSAERRAACLAAEREHVRRRIAQCKRALRKAA